MRDKPRTSRLTVVNVAANSSESRRKLAQAGMALWDFVQSEFRIADCGGVKPLAQACAAADRAERLATLIDADGEVIHGNAGPKSHPAIRDELACLAFIVRTLTRLGITDELIKPVGRPPRGIGWSPHGCNRTPLIARRRRKLNLDQIDALTIGARFTGMLSPATPTGARHGCVTARLCSRIAKGPGRELGGDYETPIPFPRDPEYEEATLFEAGLLTDRERELAVGALALFECAVLTNGPPNRDASLSICRWSPALFLSNSARATFGVII